MYNPFSLAGKTILVTGASSGIGRAIAIECSKMGATIVLTARNKERLQETLSYMEGETHSIIVANLNNEDERKILLDESPVLNGLVNCAGVQNILPFEFINYEKLHYMMNVNFIAPALLSVQFVKTKKITKNSSIVFISSINGPLIAYPGSSMYSASKGALVSLAKNMAVDLSSKKVRVNCVLPGMTETPLIHDDAFTKEQLESNMKIIPLKRFGKPEEIAYAVIYLLSDASSWVTGSSLVIDGGFTLL
jgi:NAD(P)-dependent dehydrogenase (short-subunit alcohol dehydrogenase family)